MTHETAGAEAVDESAGALVSPAQYRHERRDYYVHVAHRLMACVLCLGVGFLVVTGLAVYLVMRGPVIQNFAMTSDLRVQKLVPLDQPLVSDQGLRNWTGDALREIYSYDFVHWRDQLSSSRDLFTSKASFNAFFKALQDSGSLEVVRKNKLVVSSMLKEPPNIIRQKIVGGRMSWRVEVPLTVRYESPSSSMTQQLQISLAIQRVSQTENPRGLGISQIVAPRT